MEFWLCICEGTDQTRKQIELPENCRTYPGS